MSTTDTAGAATQPKSTRDLEEIQQQALAVAAEQYKDAVGEALFEGLKKLVEHDEKGLEKGVPMAALSLYLGFMISRLVGDALQILGPEHAPEVVTKSVFAGLAAGAQAMKEGDAPGPNETKH